jgi:hypothetical protein
MKLTVCMLEQVGSSKAGCFTEDGGAVEPCGAVCSLPTCPPGFCLLYGLLPPYFSAFLLSSLEMTDPNVYESYDEPASV